MIMDIDLRSDIDVDTHIAIDPAAPRGILLYDLVEIYGGVKVAIRGSAFFLLTKKTVEWGKPKPKCLYRRSLYRSKRSLLGDHLDNVKRFCIRCGSGDRGQSVYQSLVCRWLYYQVNR